MKKAFKKCFSAISMVLFIALFGGIGGIILDRYAIPKFADSRLFSKLSFLQKATENTTIINRTEQIVVRDDDSVEKSTSQAVTAMVGILSIEKSSLLKKTPSTTLSSPDTSVKGSGILVTNDGIIVTFRKAILEKNAQYSVSLFNGEMVVAQLIAVDTFTNLAYLKIEAGNVPAIALANSDTLRPGKKLIAIAATPQSYQNRFSGGMLNAIDQTFNLSEKTVASSEKLEGVLKMDFPDQENFIGGSVVDHNGDMVGLVGLSELDSQKNFFLIPSNVVKNSLEKVLTGTLATRASLGVYYISLTKEIALLHHLNQEVGALVFSPSGVSGLAIIAGSAAEKAHLLAGDIILDVNGIKVTPDSSLSSVIGRFQKGETVTLNIIRGEKSIAVEVSLQ